jgi:hypothetical protein
MQQSFEELLLKIQRENDPEHMEKSLKGSAIKNAFAQRKLRKDRQNELSTPSFNFQDEPTKMYDLSKPEEYAIAKPMVDQTVEKFKEEQRKKEIEEELLKKTFKGVDDIRRWLTQTPK